jgi:hypothetical protein
MNLSLVHLRILELLRQLKILSRQYPKTQIRENDHQVDAVHLGALGALTAAS